jgi:DNA replication protein DnaC
MKYSDIISLRSDFLPVVKVDEEMQDYWKRFIPTVTFENLLQRTLTAVTTNIKHERKSVWVRGTYGTGKSHACSVIKHLLCDENVAISDYIEHISGPNLKQQLKNRNKKLFPVVIRSTFDGKIKDIDSFNLVVEKRIKEDLSKVNAQIAVKSDFDHTITYLGNNAALNIDTIIAENSELRNRNIRCKDDIIKKLKAEDVDFFLVLERTLSKYSV